MDKRQQRKIREAIDGLRSFLESEESSDDELKMMMDAAEAEMARLRADVQAIIDQRAAGPAA
ncbi:MAG: hypothetical protein WB297_17900 [Actinomycetota bacterium]